MQGRRSMGCLLHETNRPASYDSTCGSPSRPERNQASPGGMVLDARRARGCPPARPGGHLIGLGSILVDGAAHLTLGGWSWEGKSSCRHS